MSAEFFDLVGARSGHFLLESGHHGELWLDLDALFEQPGRLRTPTQELARRLAVHAPDAICGPLAGGAFLALEIAALLDVEFCWTERVAPDGDGLYAARYRLPNPVGPRLQSKRVVIVDDVINAGSAVRATWQELRRHGAGVVALGAYLLLGTRGRDLADAEGVPLEGLWEREARIWEPQACPQCVAGQPLERP